MAQIGDQLTFPSPSRITDADGDTTGAESGLTKREYFAVHLFEGAISKLSINCSLLDKARYAVEAADALCQALEEREVKSRASE